MKRPRISAGGDLDRDSELHRSQRRAQKPDGGSATQS